MYGPKATARNLLCGKVAGPLASFTVAQLRKKRLMTLVQLFLIDRYKAGSVHYVTPTEDNELGFEDASDHTLPSTHARKKKESLNAIR